MAAAVAALLICATPASAAGWEETRTTWPMTDSYYNTCTGLADVLAGGEVDLSFVDSYTTACV